MIITITGTPGSGKSYIAKKIIKITERRFHYLDLNRHIIEKRLYDIYDSKAKTYDVDILKIKKLGIAFQKYSGQANKNKKHHNKIVNYNDLKSMLSREKGIIIDSHLSQYVDSDLCIVVRSDIKNIRKRLEKRSYSKKKIEENIQSEIFGICLEEAQKEKRNIIIMEN